MFPSPIPKSAVNNFLKFGVCFSRFFFFFLQSHMCILTKYRIVLCPCPPTPLHTISLEASMLSYVSVGIAVLYFTVQMTHRWLLWTALIIGVKVASYFPIAEIWCFSCICTHHLKHGCRLGAHREHGFSIHFPQRVCGELGVFKL